MSEAREKAESLWLLARMTRCADLDEQTVQAYLLALEPYTPDQVSDAVETLVRRQHIEFFPSVGKLIEAIDGPNEEKSLRAWHEALDALQEQGVYRTVRFSDPTIHWVIEHMGGWVEFCGARVEDRPWNEKRFRELYEAYRGDAAADMLPGIFELHQQPGLPGDEECQPVLVGDVLKALPEAQDGN